MAPPSTSHRTRPSALAQSAARSVSACSRNNNDNNDNNNNDKENK